MEIHLQTDGQLYPPREVPKPPKAKPVSPEKKEPACLPAEKSATPQWEDFLLLAVMFIVFRGGDQPDLFLLAALAYILFDSCFSFKNLL